MRLPWLGMVACMGLAACAPQGHYHWGGYSEALYAYYRDPTRVGEYRATLVAIVEEGGPSGRTPPGIYAELGYLELQDGNTAAARQWFEREKSVWPEAAVYMDRMIAATAAPAAGNAPGDAGSSANAGGAPGSTAAPGAATARPGS